MKLRHAEVAPGRVEAGLSGELEVHSCTCLRNFWELRLAGARELSVDLSGVDAVDADGLAELLALLATQLDEGGRVVLRATPDSVRDALQAVGLGDHAALRVEG